MSIRFSCNRPGHERNFVYQNNQLVKVSAPNVNLAYTYNQSGSLKSKISPVTMTLEYNAAGLPEMVHTQLPEGLHEQTLKWDRSGKLSFYSAPDQQKTYRYKPRGQLEKAGNEAFDFDFGMQGTGVRTAAPNQYVSQDGMDSFGKIFSEMNNQGLVVTKYNPMGEMIVQGQRQFDWDPWGRLLRVTDGGLSWEASYDALGRRLQTRYKADQGLTLTTTSIYDPEEEFGELGIKYGNKTFWKFYGPNACDAVSDENGSVVYLMQNALRQLTGIIGDHGIQYSEQALSAYGPQTNPSIPIDLLTYAQSLSWHSKSQDPTGLIWMGARYYDPRGGRFISPDPVSYPVSMDLYVYADGDPVNYFDPDGRLKSAINTPLTAKLIRPYETFGNNRNSKWDALGGSLLGAVKFSSNWLQGLGESYGALAKADFLEDFPIHQRRLIQEAEQDLWRKNEQAAARYIANNINFDPSSSTARHYETGTYYSLVIVDLVRPSPKSFKSLRPIAGLGQSTGIKGWKVGDSIRNLTSKGNIPSWPTVRQRYWKTESYLNPEKYTSLELERMKKGLAPQRKNWNTGRLESKELHHEPPQKDGGLFDFMEVWPEEHALIDNYRRLGF